MKVGDRVVCIKSHGPVKVGTEGTFAELRENGVLGFTWDDFVDGHNLNGLLGIYGVNGYYLCKDEIKPLTQSITFNYLIL